MCEPCTPDALLEAVRGLRVADPDLGFKPLLAKLRAQQPDLGAATKEVREALAALKAESEAAKAAAAAPPAADEGGAPLPVALSLACIGCARLPSDMDDEREKHPICDMCRDEKLPTTYLCGVNCPANPGAWELHGAFHKKLRKKRKGREDGGAGRQRNRETAEGQARRAAQTGDKYDELLAKGARYGSQEDYRKAGKAFREAIALKPNDPNAYFNLGVALCNSGHKVEAAQRFLEAKERYPVGSEYWAKPTASAFHMLRRKECSEAAKPEWWNDEELKALSARVLRAAPNAEPAITMRAYVLSGACGAWEVEPRSAAELKEAATCFDRSAALCDAPALKADLANNAGWCRSEADAKTGDEYDELVAEGARYAAQQDCRRAARAYREAIALRPDEPEAYANLGVALSSSELHVEAAQRFLEARDLMLVGSEHWAKATAAAFYTLIKKECNEVAKPEWWNDKELKPMSARVVRAAPDELTAHQMRADVLVGQYDCWKAGPRSAADLKEAATHLDRAVALCPAPVGKAALAGDAAWCRSAADAM